MKFVKSGPFQSFWMAGFECADHLNKYGDRVDLLNATSHLKHPLEDYQLLAPFELKTVREGIQWSRVEPKPYTYDWTSVELLMDAAELSGIQQVWDICHFGFPDDLTPLHPNFASRFEALCCAFVKFHKSKKPLHLLIVTPINEVSFLAWLGGDACGTSPYCVRQGWEVKYHLMKAYIRGVAAMKAIDPEILILTTEPLVNVAAPDNASIDEMLHAARINEEQFQALDMLCGKMCSELGGSPMYADILGFNFYYSNQWSLGEQRALPWAPHDRHESWIPLQYLLENAYQRYKRPMIISETSHPGIDRPHWLHYIAQECIEVIRQQIPLWGVCLYPIIDRPDWDHLDNWHRSGLWDEVDIPGVVAQRVLYLPYAEALLNAQNSLKLAATRMQLLPA